MLGRPLVLVAEDDAAVRELVRTRLMVANYNVHTAKTGTEALGKILQCKPDAVILDINMPELDGFGVLEALQAGELRVPTLMLTARHDSSDVRRAMMLGAKDYLAKPFNDLQLLARVGRLLRPPIEKPANQLSIEQLDAEMAMPVALQQRVEL